MATARSGASGLPLGEQRAEVGALDVAHRDEQDAVHLAGVEHLARRADGRSPRPRGTRARSACGTPGPAPRRPRSASARPAARARGRWRGTRRPCRRGPPPPRSDGRRRSIPLSARRHPLLHSSASGGAQARTGVTPTRAVVSPNGDSGACPAAAAPRAAVGSFHARRLPAPHVEARPRHAPPRRRPARRLPPRLPRLQRRAVRHRRRPGERPGPRQLDHGPREQPRRRGRVLGPDDAHRHLDPLAPQPRLPGRPARRPAGRPDLPLPPLTAALRAAAQHDPRHLAALDPGLRPVPRRPAAARRQRPRRHDQLADGLRDGLEPDDGLLQRARRRPEPARRLRVRRRHRPSPRRSATRSPS